MDREERRGWRNWSRKWRRWNVHWPEWDLGCHPDQSQLAVTHKQTKQKTGTQTQGGGVKEKQQQQYNKGSLLHAVSINLKQQKIDVNGNVKVGHAAVYSGEMDRKVDVMMLQTVETQKWFKTKKNNKPVTYTHTQMRTEALKLERGKHWKPNGDGRSSQKANL